jgi:hypothetical protein
MGKLRVIIGQGTASEVYQYTGAQGEYDTIAIGPRGLWATLPPGHAMGQPPQLLSLPAQKVPGFQMPTGKTPEGLKQFLDVNSYQSALLSMASQNQKVGQRLEYLSCTATRIEPSGDGLISVKVSDPTHTGLKEFKADQVTLATGIGPQKQLPDVKIPIEGTPDSTLGFKQIEEGIDYLTHADKLGRIVVVYGGAATGAWVAAEVNSHISQIKGETDWCWMAAPSGTGFSKSVLPGDRNAAILDQTKNQVRYEIVKAIYRKKDEIRQGADGIPSLPDRSMVELRIKYSDGSGDFRYLVDQLIFCIGGSPAADGSIARLVEDTLKGQLEPLKDQNRMVSDGSGVLAWATPTRNLIIIGAATFNFQDSAFNKKVQSAPMGFLPPNAQVPDGIAVAISTIEALNGYMPVKAMGGRVGTYITPATITADPTSASQPKKGSANPVGGQQRTNNLDFQWNINFNTSNRTQIAACLAQTTDVDSFTANLQVAMIIYLRSKNNFGLSQDQVAIILKNIEDNIKKLRSSIPDLEQRRLKVDKALGPDAGLQFYLDAMIQNPAWKSLWTDARINC